MSDDRARALRRRVDALSASQRQALAEALTRDGRARGAGRLVGFVVPADASLPRDDALRAFLAERVPDYMIPARFVALERLPRTAAGKLDRRALANAQGTELAPAQTDRAPAAARTEVEAKLVAIWKDVLKVDDVGVDDDFFELGGDSLLSIRVIGRAGREGIRIAPERFFERPTIAHMAASIGAAAPRVSANGARTAVGAAVGEAPLTPIQHWFLDAIPRHQDWWNQSYLLEVGHTMEAAQMRAVAAEIVRHHDALRLRLVRRDGQWRQLFAPPDDHPPFRAVDLGDVSPERYGARVIEEGEREQAALRVEEGRLFRCVFFHGAGGWQRILLLGHHLVLDGVSWNVILEDLATLVSQSVAGQPLTLPDHTASARSWAMGIEARAATPDIVTAAGVWAAMPADNSSAPVDFPAAAGQVDVGNANLNRDADVVAITLGADESRLLVQDAPRRLEAPPQALLLAALLLAWHRWTGAHVLRLDVEGHGRDVLGDAIDVSRTVGWFTTVFPVRLALPQRSASEAEPAAGQLVSTVQATLDALPLRGAAHGIARYLSPDEAVRAALASQPRPAVLFNYLGAHDLTLPPAARLRVTDEPHGRARSPNAPRAYVLEMNARVERGALIVVIEYSRRLQNKESVERLAGHYRDALGAIARAIPASPVPFSLAALDATGLATVADLLSELDDA